MPGLLKRVTFPRLIAVVLAFNGVVNLVTGFAPIFRAAPYLRIEKVPEFLRLSHGQRVSGLLSVGLGIVLVALAKGLYERRRRSWGWAIAILIVLVGNNLYRATTPQTSILTALLLVGLVVFRRRFDVRSETRIIFAQFLALVSVLLALTYGTVGSYLMRAHFSNMETWTDSLYFTFVTYSTLGYGDILPVTDDAKLFTVSMIVVGLGTFITALSVLAGPMLTAQLKGVFRIMTRFQALRDHVVVCGYSNVATSVIDELRDRGVPHVVIDERQDVLSVLQGKGHDVVVGDATTTETLERANLKGATALVAAFDSDSVNTLVALTAAEYRTATPGARFRIIARVEDEPNIDKIRHIGADEVISPSTMGGRLMARRAVENRAEHSEAKTKSPG